MLQGVPLGSDPVFEYLPEDTVTELQREPRGSAVAFIYLMLCILCATWWVLFFFHPGSQRYQLDMHVSICLLLFYVLATSNVISEGVPTSDSARSGRLWRAALLGHQAAGTITCYPTQ